MENKVNDTLQFIKERFPNSKFEIVHNSLSSSLKHFIIKSGTHKGFGTSHDILESIEKAYSEFIERRTLSELNAMFGNFKTSNGFAAHVNCVKAMMASKNELIERDSLLLCWHSGTPPYWLTSNEIRQLLNIENFEIFKNCMKKGLDLKLGIISQNADVFTCIESAFGKYKKKSFFFIDTKADFSLSGIMNDLVESIAYFAHFILLDNLHFVGKKSKKLISPMDHFYYYLKSDANIDWFKKSSRYVLNFKPIDIKVYTLNPEEILGIKDLSRDVSFAESDSMQTYYCGHFELKNINTKRFEQVFGTDIIYNKQPHPLA